MNWPFASLFCSHPVSKLSFGYRFVGSTIICFHLHTHTHTHTLVIAPTITTQPVSIEGALPNSNVSFSVMADGQPLNYQWSMVTERGNTITLEATEATLRLDAVTVENDGVYFCDVSNRRGSVRSDNVSLTICKCSMHIFCP